MGVKYEQAIDGEWFEVNKTGFRHMCCDCGKVHVVDFRHKKDGTLETRWKVDGRATAAARKPYRFSKDD
jgi:hypothetical protein